MADDEQQVRIAGRRLRLTNLDKVLYPATGTTKAEVIDYFSRIAPLMIPHLTGRPVTRKRWPEGVESTPFFAKDLEAGAPSWLHRMPIQHSGGAKEYPLVDDVAALVYLAQTAALELHVPQWRFDPDGLPGPPDRLVLDLDPGPGAELADCAVVARWARGILTGMGLEPYPVTSGSKGLHLYAALDGSWTSHQVSQVARELARALEADHPELVVSGMSKALRTGRVFVDWSQNNGKKTTIAPYSLRGRDQPLVAAPRTWEELDDPQLRQLAFAEVLDRADEIGDPMASLGFRAGARGGATGPLSAYIAKRDGRRTPEPVPDNPLAHATPAGERPRFVIQEHHASRLHWDFRLEHDGVYASWAVPRGVPPTPGRDNLAVQTEDHPLEYGSFEGTIPRGEYGAGTVTIWDDGRYDLEKWRDDEIILTAEGRPGGPLGRARLALIRTNGSGEKSSWLLHRMKTDAAGVPQADAAAPQPSEQADRRPPHRPDALPAGAPAAMLSVSATPGIARASAERWGAWAEIKWDGMRALGVWNGSGLRLYARSGADATPRYPDIVAGLDLGPEPLILDGEIVAMDASGRPSFTRLQQRMNLRSADEIAREVPRTPVQYVLFDLLSVQDVHAASEPLRARRAALESLAARLPAHILVPPVFDDVDAALETSRSLGLEGIVVKDPASTYRPGVRSPSWLKVKHVRTQEVVIGGMRPGRGGRAAKIGSLLVGVPTAEGLHYCGRVGSGLGEHALASLLDTLAPLVADADPFADTPPEDAADAVWVRPEVVAEVEFAEWSSSGTLRQARWRGLRPDKTPGEVTLES